MCPSNFTKKATTSEKEVQCNTMRCIVSDLQKEIDELQCHLDENNNEKCIAPDDIDSEEKHIDFRLNDKGKPYNHKLRKLYFEFLSRRIGLEHIVPLIEAVLSVVDYSTKSLPSISTASKIAYEMGSVARGHLNQVLCSNENLTMHSDATTNKGRHYYGIQYSIEGKTLTTGLREISDGKSETYVNCTIEILEDISPSVDTNNRNQILSNTSNFMTDRQKCNRIKNK